MNIDDMTYGELKQIAQMFGGQKQEVNSVFVVGKTYCIRTVTMINTGTITNITHAEIEMADAAWIADTGRYSEFLQSPAKVAREVEPYPSGTCIVSRGAIVDAALIFEAPKALK